MPFVDIPIHSTKFSEDDTGYDSSPSKGDAKARIASRAGLSSSSSSSNNQCDRIMHLVKSLPSPTDLSASHKTSDLTLSVAQRIAQFSKPSASPRKLNRTRVQPLPDSTSDSADSFVLSNHLVLVSSHSKALPRTPMASASDLPPFAGRLEYVHDDRFDSTTTVDHVKNDVIAIELIEPLSKEKQTSVPWIGRLGESLRLLSNNVLAVVFISLLGFLLFSALLVFILA